MPARDYYLKDKTLETLCQHEQRPTHTHTVAPVWRAERGQPLGGGCARPAGLGVLRSAAHRRAEFRLPGCLASGRLFHHRRGRLFQSDFNYGYTQN